ncbi:nSTAND1 domain-containing NTPase [Streptomyces resistomycificus]|uniref:Uncharacterized protein n=1 Tax=Streptomyces resistomycificus TaxID=67356 RepID=A0A0L8L7G2_9ACTN|nr:AAA family ATPase [Streptomyces resistomycificus]KOG34097.1 hypothetical protein ADK37_20440 [Streptomyces resistomycificus]KUN93010.1 hypothetical protein AQJ84_30900 [Streptomyces resistomycificus]
MIVTFYSYKGGVGRSMALANIADQLARSGMRVLMVDFDLEAPGLEHFFPISHERVRGREGLLDLLLAFKYAMSVASAETSEGEDAFRDLDRYVSTVYPRRSDGGCLDLLPAGLRLTDEQISRYGAELRRFDWHDFYFVWSGELFFEWFRRTCAERYDVVLVDSRTGVTELGGVCAYQLADTVVALCAPNLQNIEGTAWMVRHFLSPQVRAVRRDRPLEVLVVPARVDQHDPDLLAGFADRFRRSFDPFTPAALKQAGLPFWDLQVPYAPAYAFDEQVITDPGRAEERRSLANAYASLRGAITLLAPDDNPLASLRPASAPSRPGGGATEPVETRYDPTSHFASADVFLSYRAADMETADQIRELLTGRGNLQVAEPLTGQLWDEIPRAKVNLVLVGPPGELGAYQRHELHTLSAREDARLMPVLLPGVKRLPGALREFPYIDFRGGLDMDGLLQTVQAGLRSPVPADQGPDTLPRSPYPGLAPFSEADAGLFFGREELVSAVLHSLGQDQMCTILGGPGSGKTSLVNAGVLPALRAGLLPGSDLWPIVRVHQHGGAEGLLEALRSLVSRRQDSGSDLGPEDLTRALGAQFDRVVVVLDQFEELFTSADADRRAQVIGLLRRLTDAPDPVLLPLTALRSDFLVQAHEHASFLVGRTVIVPPMSREELRQAVLMPARATGLQLEPGLVERLMQDMGDEPRSLALLQSVLLSMWQRRVDGYLTHRSYEGSGGVQGGLAHAAETLFSSLSPDDRSRARELLLSLVAFAPNGPPVGRTVLASTVTAMGAAEVCELMLRHRLLVTTDDAQNEARVRLSHQAVMGAWPRFRDWIEEARSELELRQKLIAAAEDWARSGRDRKGLLGEESVTFIRTTADLRKLSPLEMAYVEESRADAEKARRLRLLSGGGLMVVLLAALALVVWLEASVLLTVTTVISTLAFPIQSAYLTLRRERRSLTL